MSNKINNKNMLWTILVLCGILNVSEATNVQIGGSSGSGSTPQIPPTASTASTASTPATPLSDEACYWLGFTVSGSPRLLNNKTTSFSGTTYNLYYNKSTVTSYVAFDAGKSLFDGSGKQTTLKIGPEGIDSPKSWVEIKFLEETVQDGKKISYADVTDVKINNENPNVVSADLVPALISALKVFNYAIYATDKTVSKDGMNWFAHSLKVKFPEAKKAELIKYLNQAISVYNEYAKANALSMVDSVSEAVDSQRPAFSSESGSEHSAQAISRQVSSVAGDTAPTAEPPLPPPAEAPTKSVVTPQGQARLVANTGMHDGGYGVQLAPMTRRNDEAPIPSGVQQFDISTPSPSRAVSKESLAPAADITTKEEALGVLRKVVENNIKISTGRHFQDATASYNIGTEIMLTVDDKKANLISLNISYISPDSVQYLVQAVLEAIIDLEKFEHDLQEVYAALKALFDGIETQLKDQSTKLAFYAALDHEFSDILGRSLVKVKAERKQVKPATVRAKKPAQLVKIIDPKEISAIQEDPKARIAQIIKHIKEIPSVSEAFKALREQRAEINKQQALAQAALTTAIDAVIKQAKDAKSDAEYQKAAEDIARLQAETDAKLKAAVKDKSDPKLQAFYSGELRRIGMIRDEVQKFIAKKARRTEIERQALARAAEIAVKKAQEEADFQAKIQQAEAKKATEDLARLQAETEAKIKAAAKDETDAKAKKDEVRRQNAIKAQALYSDRLVRVKDVLGKLQAAKAQARQDAKKPVKYLQVETHTITYKSVQAVDAEHTNQYGKFLQSITASGRTYYKIKGLTTVYSLNGDNQFVRMPKGTAFTGEEKDIIALGVSGFVFVKDPKKEIAQLQARIEYGLVLEIRVGDIMETVIDFNNRLYKNNGPNTAYKLLEIDSPKNKAIMDKVRLVVKRKPLIAQCVIDKADLEDLQKGEAMSVLALGDPQEAKPQVLSI